MSEQNQNSSAVDWAEKLKASMEDTTEEAPAPRLGEDDDLAALLRAQLARQNEASAYAFELDTEGFEEESAEDYAEEIDDDLAPWEDTEEEPEEDYEEDADQLSLEIPAETADMASVALECTDDVVCITRQLDEDYDEVTLKTTLSQLLH